MLLKLLRLHCVQFLIGLVVSVLLVAVCLWGIYWRSWSSNSINSVICMVAVYSGSFIAIRHFSFHIGALTFRYVATVFGLSLMVAIAFILIFRVDYSTWYLSISSLLSFVSLTLCNFISGVCKHKIVYYIPSERIIALPDSRQITWKKLVNTAPLNKDTVDIVMADLRANLSSEWQHFLADCALRKIPVYHSIRLQEQVSGRVRVDHMYENEVGSLLPFPTYQFVKRLLDTALIISSAPVVLPVMLFTAVLIKIESRGNVFFLQERIGQGGKRFNIYKFRSMYSGTATDQTTGAVDARVTKVGKFIRKTRIDELPQFLNVLKGEMSLIGPRAEFHKFASEYEQEIPFYSYRHVVKPGISGWAQVMQGYNFGVDATKEKLEYDLYYIKNFSFSLDLLIIFKTIQTILTGFGAR